MRQSQPVAKAGLATLIVLNPLRRYQWVAPASKKDAPIIAR
jgi:hypothetical protein